VKIINFKDEINYDARKTHKQTNNPAGNSNKKDSADNFFENLNFDSKDLQIIKSNKNILNI